MRRSDPVTGERHNVRLGAVLVIVSALGFWCVVGFAAAALWEIVTGV